MKIVKNILIAIVALVVIALIIGFFSPRIVNLERTISINATPSSIFEEINGLKAMQTWSPWAKIDPEGTEYTFEGSDTGVGAKMSWTSDNSEVGNGSQEIIESVENEKIRTKMFFGDFPDPNYASLLLNSDGESTTVTWNFEGDMGSNPVGKLWGLFMEGMLGPSYEEGLQNLKELVEAKPKYTVDISIEDVESISYLAINNVFELSKPETFTPIFEELYGKIGTFMGKKKIEPSGMPMTIYNESNETIWDADLAIPCNTEALSTTGDIMVGATTGGKTVKAIHMGDYYLLDATHAQAAKYIADNGLESSGRGYEIYITDPGVEPDTAKWMTQVFYPVK